MLSALGCQLPAASGADKIEILRYA